MDELEFLRLLNEDLNSEFVAITHYVCYAACIKGINRPELKEMFEEESASELGHAQFFADKIVVLGGTPKISTPLPAPAANEREMLSNLLELEQKTVINYGQRASQARALGLQALAVDIENILTDELEHRDELELMLR